MQKRVYAIGSAGVPVLIEHGYAPQDLRDKLLRHHELTDIGIQHSLFIADIHARLLIATRNGPITLAHWQEGSSLWDSDPPGRVFHPQAQRTTGGQESISHLLEADRSTMSHQRMATKIAGYVA